MIKYVIPNFEDYELHYSDEIQLVWSKRNEKYLKLWKDKGGYLQVHIYKNGKGKTFMIHQIVWQCIKGDIPKGLEINHINENKENNCIENLELVTHLENCNHGTRNARVAKARINHKAFSKAVVAVKKDLSEILQYPSAHEAERDVEKGFYNQNISYCCNNKKYKSHKGYYWFFKSDFEEYLIRFNNNLQDVIKYKLSLFK